jgi:peptide/nickel transport system substrate-binding protein
MAVDHHRFTSSRLTRRAFPGRAAGAVVAYGLWPSRRDLAGIATARAAPGFTLGAPEPNPKYGGILRYGIPSTPAHFDLHQSGTVNNLGTQGCMYDNLIRRDPRDSGQTIIPDLPHSWEISRDGKTYTFFLRKGVTFHDGAKFTAEDVKATYSRIVWQPQGVSIPRTPLFSTVSEINVRDATIEFKLHEPRPETFMLAAFTSGWNVIVRKKALEDSNYDLRRALNYPGTGPFRHVN